VRRASWIHEAILSRVSAGFINQLHRTISKAS